MGREIRRVPLGWEHPRGDNGRYKPMFDKDYDTAAQEWIANCIAWQPKDSCKYYWQYAGPPPDEETSRPAFTAEPTCYQIYETVSEGTPKSPVFESLDELVAWLVADGYSQQAAERFAKTGWVPSMMMRVEDGKPTEIAEGIESLAMKEIDNE